MKKILIAFDGTQFSEGAFEFAKRLNNMQPILLTAVFIPQVTYANLWSYAGGMAGPMYVPMLEQDDIGMLEENIDRFQQLCTRENIGFKVHRDFSGFALPELKRETRFADLLIISSEKFFENVAGLNKSDYIRDAIHEAECPVIVIPEKFSFPKRNIIAYDGSASSVYALRQFAYIFPELAANETLMVYSNGEDGQEDLPDEEYVEELATQHYRNLGIFTLDINPKKFNNWLKEVDGAILISGAFGRSSLSQMFKRSFVAEVISDHKLPVFIAHR